MSTELKEGGRGEKREERGEKKEMRLGEGEMEKKGKRRLIFTI